MWSVLLAYLLQRAGGQCLWGEQVTKVMHCRRHALVVGVQVGLVLRVGGRLRHLHDAGQAGVGGGGGAWERVDSLE